jgi:hypothetical protein
MEIQKIAQLLPESFGFYDLGLVQAQNINDKPVVPLDLEKSRGVAFRVYHLDEGPSALLIFVFEDGLDPSMYTEMGNTLASKLCKNLSEQEKLEMMISPPIQLKSAPLKRLIGLGSRFGGARRGYTHSYVLNGVQQSIPVETWTLPVGQSEVVDV